MSSTKKDKEIQQSFLLNHKLKLKKWYYIRFYGRPIELNKLIKDDLSLIHNRNDSENIILSYNIYYGTQYIGIILSFLLGISLSNWKFEKNRFFKRIILGLIPYFLFFSYVHIKSDYYFIIRDVVLNSRLRQKKYLVDKYGFDDEQHKNELKLLLIGSIEERKYVQSRIGNWSCIYNAFLYYLGLKKVDFK